MRRRNRMIALRNENDFAIAHRQCLIDAAIRGVHLLQRKALGPLNAIVVDFLKVHFARRVVHIVLVGRKAGPVARRREHLHHDQALRGKPGRQHIVNLASGVAAAANLDAHIVRRYQPRRKFLFGFRVAECELAISDGADCEFRMNGQIERVGKAVKYRGALANAQPFTARTCHRAHAAKHHDGQFPVRRFALVFLGRLQLARLERQELKTKVFNPVSKNFRADEQVIHASLLGQSHDSRYPVSIRSVLVRCAALLKCTRVHHAKIINLQSRPCQLRPKRDDESV